MDSTSHKILFVMEGAKEEVVVKSLQENFFVGRTMITCVFGTVIYALYNEIKQDASLDVFSILKKRIRDLKDYNRDTFSEIYLFFDYDAHASNASPVKLEALLKTFDNETENGKLYISYPMLEALKHYNNWQDFKDKIAACTPDYKRIVNKECAQKYIDFKIYNKETWKALIMAHLCKMNYIVLGLYQYPIKYFSQLLIFEKQKEKYAITQKKVGVLSAIPIFLYEYYGIEKTKTIIL